MRSQHSGDRLTASVHDVVHEPPALVGQLELQVPAVGRVVATVDEPGRDEPVAQAGRVRRVHTERAGHRPEVERPPARDHDQHP
jgi:hypothetical protein